MKCRGERTALRARSSPCLGGGSQCASPSMCLFALFHSYPNLRLACTDDDLHVRPHLSSASGAVPSPCAHPRLTVELRCADGQRKSFPAASPVESEAFLNSFSQQIPEASTAKANPLYDVIGLEAKLTPSTAADT